jgi:hypothetical protein
LTQALNEVQTLRGDLVAKAGETVGDAQARIGNALSRVNTIRTNLTQLAANATGQLKQDLTQTLARVNDLEVQLQQTVQAQASATLNAAISVETSSSN